MYVWVVTVFQGWICFWFSCFHTWMQLDIYLPVHNLMIIFFLRLTVSLTCCLRSCLFCASFLWRSHLLKTSSPLGSKRRKPAQKKEKLCFGENISRVLACFPSLHYIKTRQFICSPCFPDFTILIIINLPFVPSNADMIWSLTNSQFVSFYLNCVN